MSAPVLRAVIYPRVSSEDQREKGTIEAQKFDGAQIVERQGWRLVKPADHYSDDGKTAKAGHLDKRDGFARLVADMQRTPRPFDVVVLADLDRLTRSRDIRERGEILGAFQRSGVRIFDAMKGQLLDLSTSTGDLMAVLGTWFAAEDNRKRSERTRAGQRRAAREGRKPKGRTPFGWRFSKESGWSLDPVCAPIVREIFVRIARGDSMATIAEDFHRRGLPTAEGKPTGGTWGASRVWDLVHARELYARGQWVAVRSDGLTVQLPPIVTEAQAEAAHRTLEAQGRRHKGCVPQEYLIQGLVRCACCGAAVNATYSRSQGVIHRYYVCAHRRRRPIGGEPCTLPIMRADDVDARVWGAVSDVLERPEYIEAALREQAASAEEHALFARDLADAEAKLTDFDRRAKRIAADYAAGVIPDEVWSDHVATLKTRRAMLVRQVEAARAGIDLSVAQKTRTTTVLEAVKRLRRKLRGADFATRRELVQALIPGEGEHMITVGADAKLNVPVVLVDEGSVFAQLGAGR